MIYIEEQLEVVKRISLIVSLVMFLVVRPVFPAADFCILSVLPTRGTLQYVGINRLKLNSILTKGGNEPKIYLMDNKASTDL